MSSSESGTSSDGSDNGGSGGAIAKLASLSAGAAAFLVSLAEDPQGTIYGFIETWVVEFLITPVLDFIVDGFGAVADSFLYIAFGSDRMVGNYASIGVLDIPTYIVSLIIAALSPAGSAVLGVIGTVNTAVASVAAKAGIAAPVVIPGLQIAWIAIATWVLVTIVSAIDIPGVRLASLLSRLLAPVRAAFGWFR